MSADTGAVCVRIQSRIVGVHPHLAPWQHTSDELRDASHTRDRLCAQYTCAADGTEESAVVGRLFFGAHEPEFLCNTQLDEHVAVC